eukprot:2305852-Rhodomonas_salina.1
MKQARLQELVQPSPLVGAVNVENGELIEGAPFLKYNTSLNGLEHESAEEIEKVLCCTSARWLLCSMPEGCANVVTDLPLPPFVLCVEQGA